MTAKEQLRQTVEEFSEAEAAAALEILASRGKRDPVIEFLDNAPIDDEPETEAERLAVAEGIEALRRGDTISLEDLERELG